MGSSIELGDYIIQAISFANLFKYEVRRKGENYSYPSAGVYLTPEQAIAEAKRLIESGSLIITPIIEEGE